MLSSIFNSDLRASRWTRTLAAGIVAALLGLGTLEGLMRTHGSGPNVRDDERLWATWRREVDQHPDATVVLGSSRMQLAFSIPTWREAFPGKRVIQLSVNGGNSVPLLEDLADSPFSGVALCEFDYWHLLPGAARNHAEDFVRFYHEKWFSPFLDLEVWLRAHSQGNLAFLREEAGIGSAFKGLLRGKDLHFKPYYARTFYNRTIDADYSSVDPRGIIGKWHADIPEYLGRLAAFTPADRDAQLSRTRAAIQKIQSRGGKVILIRPPSSGKLYQLDEEATPRKTHWEEITRGVPSFHFADNPTTRALICPDESHLDVKDKPVFTRELARDLQTRGFLR